MRIALFRGQSPERRGAISSTAPKLQLEAIASALSTRDVAAEGALRWTRWFRSRSGAYRRSAYADRERFWMMLTDLFPRQGAVSGGWSGQSSQAYDRSQLQNASEARETRAAAYRNL